MRIINAMFSQGSGGIEQCMMDYCKALLLRNHKVSALVHPKSTTHQALLDICGVNVLGVKNFGQYDVFAKLYIRKILQQTSPDVVIAHGNRAVSLLKWPCKSLGIALVGVSHNYNIKRLIGLDGVFAITKDLQKTVIQAGQPKQRIFLMPNMIHMPDKEPDLFKAYHKPIKIGTMGRFVKKKGMGEFLHALAEIKQQGIKFQAIIGGDGEESGNLHQLRTALGLEKDVVFSGWVKNKRAFFESIDIFCLPSLHEPFGIILLEAFAAKKPVIAFKSEGPLEIATHNNDAVLVECGNSKALAKEIKNFIKDRSHAQKMAENAYHTAKNYDIHTAAITMEEHLQKIVALKV